MSKKQIKLFKRITFLSLFLSLILGFSVSVYALDIGSLKQTAESIELGQEINGRISEYEKSFWYTFTASEETEDWVTNSWFRFDITCSNKTTYKKLQVRLYNKNNILIMSSDLSDGAKYLYKKLTPSEEYWLNISLDPNDMNATADFVFAITELFDEAGETMEEAADLNLNEALNAELQSPYEETDWYVFSGEESSVKLTIKNTNVSYFAAQLYDVDGLKIGDLMEISAGTGYSQIIPLNNQIRYLKIYSKYEYGGKYVVQIENEQTKTEEIILSDSIVYLEKGETYNLSATTYPDESNTKVLKWKSSNKKVVSVNKDGMVTAKKVGKGLIICSATDGSGISVTCKIRVMKNKPVVDDSDNSNPDDITL